jgi:membrane protease YdiL (CAAX protease family)
LPTPHWRGVPLPPWAVLLAAAAVAGFVAGVLTPVALLALAVLCALAGAARSAPRGGGTFTVLAAAWALALALHAVPGFRNPVLLAGVRFTPDAVPFTLAPSFDKAAAGLVLVAAFCRPGRGRDGRPWVLRTLAGALATCIVVIGLAVAIGYTRFEPKWPDAAPLFLAGNLLFTCVAEEAFFRGLIQERLERLADAGGRAAWRVAAIAVGAILFGLAHAGGGPLFMLLAVVAGVGYGLTYSATRRIEAAILVHFALNAAHFTGFVYPALAR